MLASQTYLCFTTYLINRASALLMQGQWAVKTMEYQWNLYRYVNKIFNINLQIYTQATLIVVFRFSLSETLS